MPPKSLPEGADLQGVSGKKQASPTDTPASADISIQRPLERLFFLSDPHIPFHDKRALELAFKVIRRFKPAVLVSIGDFVDFFSVSSFSKDPQRAFKLEQEVEIANKVLDRIDKLVPGRRIYLAGNHEDRLRRYLQDKAPALYAFNNVEKYLRLHERGWEYVPYKASTKLGRVNLAHDVGSSTRYSVYKTLDTFQASVVTGHTHRLAYVVEGDARGNSHVGAQFGWLGDVRKVDYMHTVQARRNWALGFGVGYLQPANGNVHLVPVPIVNYSVVVEGKLYSA